MPRRNFSTLNRIVVVTHLQCRIAALQILLDIDAIESKIAVLVLVKNFLIETPSGVADFKSRGGRCQDVGRNDRRKIHRLAVRRCSRLPPASGTCDSSRTLNALDIVMKLETLTKEIAG